MTRTVLVTGAGSGIGAAIARAFAEQGDTVFGGDISRERIDATFAGLDHAAIPLVFDVSDEEAVDRAVATAEQHDGGLDVLVSCAGVGDGSPAFAETSTELWQRVLAINLSGTFFANRAAARAMIPRGSGRIVNIASVSAFSGRANGVPYTVSKAGIVGMTQRLAYELGPRGLTVNAVLPGSIVTGIGSSTPEILGVDFPGKEQPRISDEALRNLIPGGRRGYAEEVAAAAVFLASPAASYINGVALPVDGGWLAS